jgi:hypothetical protein
VSGDTTGVDWSAFAASIFNPPLPRLGPVLDTARELARERVRAVRTDTGSPRLDIEARARALCDPGFLAESWEALCLRHGGDEIFERSLRGEVSFAPYLPLREGVPLPRAMPGAVGSVPRDMETMVALLAAEPGHLRTAEAVAAEFSREVAQWHPVATSGVTWGPVSERWEGPRYDGIADAASDAVRGTFVFPREEERAMRAAMGLPARDEAMTTSSIASRPRGRALFSAAYDAADWLRWRRVPRERERHAAGLFDAVITVWELGYVILDTLGDTVLLGVPIETGWVAPTLAALRREAVRRYGAEL